MQHGLEGAERFGYTHVMCTGPIPQLVVCDPEVGSNVQHILSDSECLLVLFTVVVKLSIACHSTGITLPTSSLFPI